MHKYLNRLLNVLSVLAVITLIGTSLRTLIYWFIGIETERVFRYELFVIWGICIAVLVLRSLLTKKTNL